MYDAEFREFLGAMYSSPVFHIFPKSQFLKNYINSPPFHANGKTCYLLFNSTFFNLTLGNLPITHVELSPFFHSDLVELRFLRSPGDLAVRAKNQRFHISMPGPLCQPLRTTPGCGVRGK